MPVFGHWQVQNFKPPRLINKVLKKQGIFIFDVIRVNKCEPNRDFRFIENARLPFEDKFKKFIS